MLRGRIGPAASSADVAGAQLPSRRGKLAIASQLLRLGLAHSWSDDQWLSQSWLASVPRPASARNFTAGSVSAAIEEPTESGLVCAPTFPSVYTHPSWLVHYRGTSIALGGTWQQVPYEWNGRNATGDQWASGIHHVARGQCLYTWHARMSGIPALIAYLHSPQFGATTPPPGGEGCGGGDDGGDAAELNAESSCPPTGVGSGQSHLICTTVYLTIEISYDGGFTWETFWEGWGTECEFATE